MTNAFTTKLFAGALALLATAGLGVFEAAALAANTYVSGIGLDSNPCTRAAPCQSFAHAQTQTADQGTIICLDPASYGGFTINRSLTIDCQAGGGSFHAQQIAIDAPNAFVKLLHVGVDNLRNSYYAIGIFNAAAVHLDGVVVTGSNGAGIRDQRTGPGQLIIKDSLVNLNFGVGIAVGPGGGSTLNVVLDNVTSVGNLYGVAAANRCADHDQPLGDFRQLQRRCGGRSRRADHGRQLHHHSQQPRCPKFFVGAAGKHQRLVQQHGDLGRHRQLRQQPPVRQRNGRDAPDTSGGVQHLTRGNSRSTRNGPS